MADLVRDGYLTERTFVAAARSLTPNFQTSVSAVLTQTFNVRVWWKLKSHPGFLLLRPLRLILGAFLGHCRFFLENKPVCTHLSTLEQFEHLQCVLSDADPQLADEVRKQVPAWGAGGIRVQRPSRRGPDDPFYRRRVCFHPASNPAVWISTGKTMRASHNQKGTELDNSCVSVWRLYK